ncbi:hypothetical protein [Actinomyces trachealis]|uniref:hypothetical protein n=1 Tax=Actinomyces trachealis TaxID=2763540 RepID=UPI001F1E6B91|nr:hypothetical protein [Actinomyces trachealis]
MKNKVALRPALPTPPDTRRHPRRTTQVRRNLVVLAWVLAAALLALLVLTGPLAAWGQWLPLHALLLGGIGSAITVWSAHFADTLLRRPALGGATLLDVRLYAHSLGAVLVLADITAGRDALTLTGVGVVVASALTGALAITLQYRRALAPRLAGLALHYAVALVLLAVGAALGYLTNWANDHGRAPLSDALYVAHTTTMLLGFVGTTVLGTLTVLWPTMLRTKTEPEAPRWARAGLPLLVAGTALLAAAGIWAPLAALGALAYLAGAAGVLVPAWRTAHRVPPTSFATASAAAAVAWFLACLLWVGVGVSVAGSGDADPGAARDVIHAVRVPLAAGFALQVLAAALSYLTPVMLGGGTGHHPRNQRDHGPGRRLPARDRQHLPPARRARAPAVARAGGHRPGRRGLRRLRPGGHGARLGRGPPPQEGRRRRHLPADSPRRRPLPPGS